MSSRSGHQRANDSADEFRVGYSGNMFDYSDMLCDLAQLALKQTDVRIEFRGRPRWPQALVDEMTTPSSTARFRSPDQPLTTGWVRSTRT